MKFISLLRHVVGKTIEYIGIFCAIADFICIIYFDEHKAIIALLAFIAFLIIILIRVFYFFSSYLEATEPNGYKNLATYSKYITTDGDVIIFELHKYIVCKQLIMSSHEHEYNWSGTKQPIITSEIAGSIRNIPTDAGQWNKVIIELEKPLVYNDFAIVQLRMQLDDIDHASKTHILQRVERELQLIQFEAELKYKSQQTGLIPDARLSYRKVGMPVDVDFELITTVPFDRLTSSYKHIVYNPKVNYAYKLEWVR